YGRKIVVSAGGTREPIDPVRYLSNRSTGRQGHALAQAALDAGAREVVLVSASEWLPVPVGAEVINVDTADEMKEAITTVCADTDLLIMAAAVADFRPASAAGQKIKKESVSGDLSLQLLPTADILTEIKASREETGYPRVVVGFAAETENLLDNAQAKLERKGLDIMVANDITAEDAGFGVETNRVVILDADGNRYPLDLATKAVISEAIINHVADLLGD
ncbi:MAG: phosphopantothenoylcysteine decarboxylase, partial [Phototrophicaceae bacterium]